MNCEHWWRTIHEPAYGYVTVCTECGLRESAEHSQDCFDMAVNIGKPCFCGAQEEFEKYELNRFGGK